mmetsp:Transcript_3676/g.11821  ORF Transcript_3676/g.11821 Transcript_3676/m.11821 type:complete len:209 (-) Transcript_3676:375-1001(-)
MPARALSRTGGRPRLRGERAPERRGGPGEAPPEDGAVPALAGSCWVPARALSLQKSSHFTSGAVLWAAPVPPWSPSAPPAALEKGSCVGEEEEAFAVAFRGRRSRLRQRREGVRALHQARGEEEQRHSCLLLGAGGALPQPARGHTCAPVGPRLGCVGAGGFPGRLRPSWGVTAGAGVGPRVRQRRGFAGAAAVGRTPPGRRRGVGCR